MTLPSIVVDVAYGKPQYRPTARFASVGQAMRSGDPEREPPSFTKRAIAVVSRGPPKRSVSMLLARPHEGAVVVPSKRSIFVSKPNTLNPEQAAFWDRLRRILIERGLAPRTLGETDYPNSAPIAAVRRVLEDCDGAMILGMAQLSVSEGVLKANSPNESNAADSLWPTAWNHIEAGMAFMLDLPMLIIRERGVADGVFDVGNTDRFVHQADLSLGWLESERFLQPFNEWLDEIWRRRL
jgi:hypothetical protein